MSLVDGAAITNLKSLAERTGKDICNQLVRMFVESTPEAFQKMREALSKSDFETFSREAHSLKSSSGNLGAMAMSEHCLKIEKAVREEGCTDVGQLSAWTEELEELFVGSSEEIMKLAA